MIQNGNWKSRRLRRPNTPACREETSSMIDAAEKARDALVDLPHEDGATLDRGVGSDRIIIHAYNTWPKGFTVEFPNRGYSLGCNWKWTKHYLSRAIESEEG